MKGGCRWEQEGREDRERQLICWYAEHSSDWIECPALSPSLSSLDIVTAQFQLNDVYFYIIHIFLFIHIEYILYYILDISTSNCILEIFLSWNIGDNDHWSLFSCQGQGQKKEQVDVSSFIALLRKFDLSRIIFYCININTTWSKLVWMWKHRYNSFSCLASSNHSLLEFQFEWFNQLKLH